MTCGSKPCYSWPINSFLRLICFLFLILLNCGYTLRKQISKMWPQIYNYLTILAIFLAVLRRVNREIKSCNYPFYFLFREKTKTNKQQQKNNF